MKIKFGSHELFLHHSGIIFWPKHHMAIVSDMHLEKGSHFAQRGFMVPPYDSAVTLKKLQQFCETHPVKRLLILGDCFHDPRGYNRLVAEDRSLFDQLLKYNPIWIKGNHDKDFVPDNFESHDIYSLDGLNFIHEATRNGSNEISGHYHPKIMVEHKGALISRACFIEDGNKMILPSFGAYTGGLDIKDKAMVGLLTAPMRAYLLGEKRLYLLPVA